MSFNLGVLMLVATNLILQRDQKLFHSIELLMELLMDQVHTAIIDECGCTAEASVGLLLRMQLRNLILVGDHKQCVHEQPPRLCGW